MARDMYDIFVESLDIKKLTLIINSDFEEEDKKKLIGYAISRKLEGTNINMPKKIHKSDFADVIIKYTNLKPKEIMDITELTHETIYSRIRKHDR